jgi:Mlc titration factor MtfA (ptsG expression regulator)
MWWRRRDSGADPISAADWEAAFDALPLLDGLDAETRARLQQMAARFLQQKQLEPVQGTELDEPMRLELALQATLPVLELGLDWYRGWHTLILYPDQFVPAREVMDEDGLVWIDDEPKSGEAWEQGPVILSLTDAAAGCERDGYNVVIHELAHKLDLLDGAANGHPPLHRGMSDAHWAEIFGAAYADLCRRCEAIDAEEPLADTAHRNPGLDDGIDPYGSESPAEFFAVCSETFFELPHRLQAIYPDVYAQLQAFYRQDPARRLPEQR